MGEVYRARDTKLGRDVALKVLPAIFAADPERLHRFEREAQSLASLNHPHIAQIYGVLEDPPALVMELVDGEDLSQRLARGAIPIDEALHIARQIAEALGAAHERGIVHRDLKPANVKLRSDGAVKVLDFGLAKALDSSPAHAVADSPTFTTPATERGMILGTAAYMAPEQARGKPVDRRADVWAFGVVLYEMLAGRRAFDGAGTSDLLAAILKDDPPMAALPPDTPRSIHRLLRRCLEKDREKRLDSMVAVRLEIDEALAPQLPVSPDFIASGPRKNQRPAIGRVLPWIAAAAALAALAAGAVFYRRSGAPPATALRVAADIGFEGFMVADLVPALALSPDGQTVAFTGRTAQDARQRVYTRRLDRLGATMLAGTEDADDPFFSPDGQWIGYFSHGKLFKVSAAGGASVALADIQIDRGGAWGEDEVITFTPQPTPGGRLMRVPAAGGEAKPLGPMVEGHLTQRWPQALPGHRAILYTGSRNVDTFEDACLVAQTLDGAAPRVVHCGGYFWRYLPSGHVIYVHNATLFAAPFDVSQLKVTGPAVPVVDQIRSTAASGAAQFSVGGNVLVYLPGDARANAVGIQFVDRAGKTTPVSGLPSDWQSMTFSPDGRQIALEVGGQYHGVWLYDVARQTASGLAVHKWNDVSPIWTPDGRRITYGSAQGGPPNIVSIPADGSGDPERLTQGATVQIPTSWSPDGRTLAFTQQTGANQFDVWLLPMEGAADRLKPGPPRPFAASPATEALGAFSPDGKWIAYISDESGVYQIYVRAANGAGGKWQISTTDGAWPQWSPKKPELLYGTIDGRVMFVTYDAAGGAFRASRPEPWTPARFTAQGTYAPFALHPDGTRILMAPPNPTAPTQKVVLFTNFLDELKTRVGAR
jgi:serine/threonine-protein kinase